MGSGHVIIWPKNSQLGQEFSIDCIPVLTTMRIADAASGNELNLFEGPLSDKYHA